jgi:hypothetical protein
MVLAWLPFPGKPRATGQVPGPVTAGRLAHGYLQSVRERW